MGFASICRSLEETGVMALICFGRCRDRHGCQALASFNSQRFSPQRIKTSNTHSRFEQFFRTKSLKKTAPSSPSFFFFCNSPISEYSMQLNASRNKVLQSQNDVVNSMKEAASKELPNVSQVK